MKNIILVLSLFFVAISSVFSQEKTSAEEKGDQLFFRYAYDKAIVSYEKAKSLTLSGERNLAECYFNMGQDANAELTYEKILNTISNALPEDFYNYAMVLKKQGRYVGANGWMNKFVESAPNDLRAKSYVKNNDQFESYLNGDAKCTITKLAMNTTSQDFGTSFYNEIIVYASSNVKPAMIKRKYNWTGQPFLNLYEAQVEGGELVKREFFNKKNNEKMHEGLASFSSNGMKMAYTRNNEKDYNHDDIVELQIYLSEFRNGKWTDAVPFAYNNEMYSVGHPCLSSDGMTMFFASDMPNGFGGVDLYKTQIDGNGNWTTPVNLGNTINTEGDEMFPFFEDAKQTLSFASNGHFGLGGLDVFSCVLNGNSWGEVFNVGAPINSQSDDFSFIFNSEKRKGYFSTNRFNGLGDDDIYSIERSVTEIRNKLIVGVVKDNKGNVIPETFVSLYDTQDSLLAYVIADNEGMFKFNVVTDRNYYLTGSKAKFSKGSARATSFGELDTIFVNLVLLQEETTVVPIDNGLTKIAKLNPIHFDFDKSEIRADAAEELDKIVKTMNAYPKMEIQLSAFADCRGTKEYNEILAQNRALATTSYIQNRISNPQRISGKGYGESRAVNDCICNDQGYSECSENEHAENRRTEFVIIK
jgi:outer membrane protein OmpA-like peptidoglycan-associated protein